jgi:predicted acetyltransferase
VEPGAETAVSGGAVEVRTITQAEVDAWSDGLEIGFLRVPAKGLGTFRSSYIDLDRTWGAFDGERVVGTLRSYRTELTVPGGAFLPASAVTNVAVTATHRRSGLMRRMMEPDLAASAARGEPVAVLIPSEYPIYGRFGFGPATEHVWLSLDAGRARFLPPPWGAVELADVRTFLAEAPHVYDRYRAAAPGNIARPDWKWDVLAGTAPSPGGEDHSRAFRALLRDGSGAARGYAVYALGEVEWESGRPQVTLEVHELAGEDPAAEAELWRYCAQVDWVRTVQALPRSPHEGLRWFLADARALRLSGHSDMMWARLLDVPAALSARSYAVDGRVVFEVVDPLGYAAGRYELDVSGGAGTCGPRSAEPDLTVPVDVLSGAFLGGTSLLALRQAGRVEEHRPGAVAKADQLFRWPVPPVCLTWF